MKTIFQLVIFFLVIGCKAQKADVDLKDASFFEFSDAKDMTGLTFENHSNAARRM